MALGKINLSITDEAGAVVDGASVEVREEVGGLPLAALFSDRDGAVGISNPFTASDGADASFFVIGGAYKITATLGGYTRTWRYVQAGLLQEQDEFPTATGSAPGIIELASDAEAQAKAATDRAITPANLAALGSTDAFEGLVELATDAETATGTDTARAITPANLQAAGLKQGKHTVWVPASAMVPATTNGPALVKIEEANGANYNVLDFDASTAETAYFSVAMPKSWDLGTVTFQAYWMTAGAVSTGVEWGFAGISMGDNEAISVTFSASVVVSDAAQGAANELYITAESSPVTIAGTPADNDLVLFRVRRIATNTGDDMTQDARLIGVKMFMTLDEPNDA